MDLEKQIADSNPINLPQRSLEEFSRYDDLIYACIHGNTGSFPQTLIFLMAERHEKMKAELEEAWTIINVLNMSELDRGESYPRAMQWLSRNENYNPNKKPSA